MILKIYNDGNFCQAINMNHVVAVNAKKYVTSTYNPEEILSTGAVELIFANENFMPKAIKLNHATEQKLIDQSNPDRHWRSNEIIREIAEEISCYWDCANGVTLLNIDISDKYEKGYEII